MFSARKSPNSAGFVRLLAAVIAWSAPLLAQSQPSALSQLSEATDLASAGRYEEAEKIFHELEKAYPANPEVSYRFGVVLLRRKKLKAASQRLESAAKSSPEATLVWLALAQVRLQTENREGALEAAGKAGKLGRDEPPVWRALAMFYAQAGEFAKAAEYESRWSAASPGDPASVPRAVEYHIRAGQADSAIELAGAALAGNGSAVLHNLLGKAYRIKADPARAVEEFQQAIRLDAGQPAYYADLAELFLDHNTPEPAAMLLESALRRFPDDPVLLRLRGLAYYATGDAERALTRFLRVMELDPDSEVSYASLEPLLPEAGERLDVIAEKLRIFRTKHTASPLGHYLLALALSMKARGKENPEELLRKAIAVEPGFWPAYFELHKHLKTGGKIEEAAEVLRKTIELNPNSAPAHYSLAQIYAQLGETERAKAERRLHHELAASQREEEEQRRRQAPRLRYELVRP